MEVVKLARDYTRKLLGIDDTALKTFKAKVETARALSSSPEEFKVNIAAAETEFKAAMDAQKTAADAARITHKDELQKIYDGTVQVFLARGTGVSLGRGDDHRHGAPSLERGRRGPGGRGHDGGGRDDDASGETNRGPRMMFGDGEFTGDFAQMKQHLGKGEGSSMGLDDAAVSTECSAAASALEALVGTPESSADSSTESGS